MSRSGQEHRRADRAQQVALFRYQLIREAADPGLSTRQRGRLVRELASRAHPGPFGDPETYVDRGHTVAQLPYRLPGENGALAVDHGPGDGVEP